MKKLFSFFIILTLVLSIITCQSSYAVGFNINTDKIIEKSKEIGEEVGDQIVEKGKEIAANMFDIASHWAKDYIQSLIDKGIITGYPDGSFKPDNSITRAEAAKLLLTSNGINPGNSSSGHWASNYINKSIDKGYIKNGEFDNIDKTINRGEMARMIARAMSDNPKNIDELKKQITDYSKIPGEYQEYVAKVYAAGIITGYEDGLFRYERTLTRAEASTMIIRLLEKDKRKIPTIKKGYKEASEFSSRPITDFISEGIPQAYINNKRQKIDSVYISSFGDLPLKIGDTTVYKIEHDTTGQDCLKITTDSSSRGSIDISYVKLGNKEGVTVTPLKTVDKNEDGTYSYYYRSISFFYRKKTDANAFNSDYIILTSISPGESILIDNPFKK